MRPIIPLELAGNNKLDYDLYDDKGNLVYTSGEELTPGLLIQLSYKKIFIKDSTTGANVETSVIENTIPKIQKPVFSERATNTLLKKTKTILKNVYNKEKLDTSSLIEATNIIVDEVSRHFEKIECIGQLRIFDEYTFSHTVNVSAMSSALGMALGFDDPEIKELSLGALMHDIGKMLVPKSILNKPGKLDADEFEIMKSHTLLGYRYIVDNLEIDDEIAKVALDHQEKYDGNGYPNGLKGKEINLYAQVAAITDVYDALISHRVYKRAIEPAKAIDIMMTESGKYFNPYMLSKFIELTDPRYKASGLNFKKQC